MNTRSDDAITMMMADRITRLEAETNRLREDAASAQIELTALRRAVLEVHGRLWTDIVQRAHQIAAEERSAVR